jgi:hypothetical protein
MYSNTNVYDKYLLFPRRNILSPVGQVNLINWVNNSDRVLAWINDSGQEFAWVGIIA